MAASTARRRGGTKFDRERVQETWKRYDDGLAASAAWRTELRRAYNYYENSQRPKSLSEYDNVLYVVLNLIRARVDTKIGILTSAKPVVSVTGRGVEDAEIAAAYKDLLEYSAEEDHFDNRIKDCVADLCKCGLGVLEEVFDPDLMQMTSHGWAPGNLRASIGDPSAYIVDPANRNFALEGHNGPDWYIVESEEEVDELAMLYPAHARKIKAMSQSDNKLPNEYKATDEDYDAKSGAGEDDSDTDKEKPLGKKTVKVLTMWYLDPQPVDRVFETLEDGTTRLAVDEQSGEPLEPEDINELDRLMRGLAGQKQTNPYEVMRRIEKKVRYRVVCGDLLLEDKPSPYQHGGWPAVFFSGTMHRGEPMPYGEVHQLFDAQDLYNKLNSVILDNAIRTNNTGWKLEEGAMSQEAEDDLRNNGAQPGFIAKMRMGRVDGLQRIESGQLPHGLWTIQQDVRQNFDELSSLYQTQRGGMPYETSGKAVIALQQAADSALVQLQAHIEHAIKEWGRKRLSNILQFYSYEKSWRISNRAKELDQYYITQFVGNEEGQATLGLFKLEDQNPEPKLLTKDFAALEFDIRLKMGTGHERSRDQKLDEAKFLFSSGAVDELYLLEQFEVEERREVMKRVQERDQARALGTQVMKFKEENPEAGQFLDQFLQNPQAAMQSLKPAQPRLAVAS